MSKYKFNLSYKDVDKLIPIDLSKIDSLNNKELKSIKTIDEYTTTFENYIELINELKKQNLIPEYINNLYITFDHKIDKKTIEQQLYAFSKTLFFKKDVEKLKTSYATKKIRDHINDGSYMLNVIELYAKKYPHKNFGTIESVSSIMAHYGHHNLTPSEYSEYVDAVEYLINYIFYKKDSNDKQIPDYRKVRDFLCYISGEKPIKIKKDKKEEKKEEVKPKVEEYEQISLFDNIEDNVTLSEHRRSIKDFLDDYEEDLFEPYRDGNDWIAPITKKEIKESLDDYAKKLCLKRDNGEYE